MGLSGFGWQWADLDGLWLGRLALYSVVLDWIGLDGSVLNWIGLDWFRSHCWFGLGLLGLDGIGLNGVGADWIELDGVWLDWMALH
jgi:hypothetical protein